MANGFARRLDTLPIERLTLRPARGGPTSELPTITDLTEDSRQVTPGALFVARRGERFDGRSFAPDAIARGAAAILTDDPQLATMSCTHSTTVLVTDDLPSSTARLAEAFFGNPSDHLAVVGVTGTNGKTTITHAIRSLCSAGGRRCGVVGTIANDDGTRTERATLTTPQAIDLSRTLGRMVHSRCDAAAIEVSSHALDQQRAGAIRFAVAVLTNLTGDHLDYHRTMDAYADAKSRLFESLGPDAVAVVNADDPWCDRLVAQCRAPLVRCSMVDASAHAHATILDRSLDGMTLRLTGPWGRIASRVGMLAPHDAMNLLQAVAAAHALGLGCDELARGLAAITPPAGRLERIDAPAPGPAVFVDFAHTDDALARSAGALASLKGQGQFWIVFGCGGDRDATKRPRMAAAAGAHADRLVVTSDNPRTEDPGRIIEQILRGVPPGARVVVEPDRRKAIARAINDAGDHDIVLIAGKGHERAQLVADGSGGLRQLTLIDQDEARRALAERAGSGRAGASERCA